MPGKGEGIVGFVLGRTGVIGVELGFLVGPSKGTKGCSGGLPLPLPPPPLPPDSTIVDGVAWSSSDVSISAAGIVMLDIVL